jgi:hypothetical protein
MREGPSKPACRGGTDFKPPKAAVVKSQGGERLEKVTAGSPQQERDESRGLRTANVRLDLGLT